MTALEDIGKLWWQAYLDLQRMARQMGPVLLILVGIYVATMMGWFTVPRLIDTDAGRLAMRYLLLVGAAWVATPYYIALHRFVALDEVRWIPARASYGPASSAYLAWAATLLMLGFGPLLLIELLAAMQAGSGFFALLLIGAIAYALVRLTTIMPLAALEPQRATWQEAIGQTRGHFWLIVSATAGATLPAYLLLLALLPAAASRSIEPVLFMLVMLAALLLMQLVPLSIGTRLYQKFRAPAA